MEGQVLEEEVASRAERRDEDLRADRSLIPAVATAACCVFPSMRFCLISLTCASLSIGNNHSRALTRRQHGRRDRQK